MRVFWITWIVRRPKPKPKDLTGPATQYSGLAGCYTSEYVDRTAAQIRRSEA